MHGGTEAAEGCDFTSEATSLQGRRQPQRRCGTRSTPLSSAAHSYLVEGVLCEGYRFPDVTRSHETVNYSIDHNRVRCDSLVGHFHHNLNEEHRAAAAAAAGNKGKEHVDRFEGLFQFPTQRGKEAWVIQRMWLRQTASTMDAYTLGCVGAHRLSAGNKNGPRTASTAQKRFDFPPDKHKNLQPNQERIRSPTTTTQQGAQPSFQPTPLMLQKQPDPH